HHHGVEIPVRWPEMGPISADAPRLQGKPADEAMLDGDCEAADVAGGARVRHEHAEAIVMSAGFKGAEVDPALEPGQLAFELGRERAGKVLFELDTEYPGPRAGERTGVYGAAQAGESIGDGGTSWVGERRCRGRRTGASQQHLIGLALVERSDREHAHLL